MTIPRIDVVRLRAATVEDHGTPLPDWSDVTETTIADCMISPLTGEELLIHRDASKTVVKLFTPEGTDLLATDRIQVGEYTYDVSDVQNWSSATLSNVSALLTHWEG